MSKPYLANSIRLLQRTLNEAYPALASEQRGPLTLAEIHQTEDALGMLMLEWRRRFGTEYRS